MKPLLTIIAVLLLIGEASAQGERNRIVGKVVDAETVDVNGIQVKVNFRGRTAELKEVVGTRRTLYGTLIYTKKDKTFSMNVSEIDHPSSDNRIEVYNVNYPITKVKKDHCLIRTKYGAYKFFFHNMDEELSFNIQSGKARQVVVCIFYYDDEAKEICLKYPPNDELKRRLELNLENRARMFFLKD